MNGKWRKLKSMFPATSGPIIIPAIMYANRFGWLSFLKSRLTIVAAIIISASWMKSSIGAVTKSPHKIIQRLPSKVVSNIKTKRFEKQIFFDLRICAILSISFKFAD